MKFLTSTTILVLLLSCQRKSTPVITDRNIPPPEINKQVYPPKSDVAVDFEKGKQLYTTACKSCHDLPEVTSFAAKAWDGHLYSMFPRTKLTSDEAHQVRAYVLANAKK